MDKGVLNESLLEKNIEQVQLYSDEEKESLTAICDKFYEFSKSYCSANTTILNNNIDELKSNISTIYAKRNQYVKILNEVIEKYDVLSNITVATFDKDV